MRKEKTTVRIFPDKIVFGNLVIMRFSVHLCQRKFLNKHLRFSIHVGKKEKKHGSWANLKGGGMMFIYMRSMLLYVICLLLVYVCYMLLYVICPLYVMCLLCV